MDPWLITAEERARHSDQFASLSPVNGFLNGGQARGFLMQSGLVPMVLAQVWGLADMNGDGQFDLNEFSIACKLITMKLTGYEIPATLPPAVLCMPQMGGFGGMPQQQQQQQQQPGMMQMQPQGNVKKTIKLCSIAFCLIEKSWLAFRTFCSPFHDLPSCFRPWGTPVTGHDTCDIWGGIHQTQAKF
jgi:hypothetical protein